jgi:hypothetical protein
MIDLSLVGANRHRPDPLAQRGSESLGLKIEVRAAKDATGADKPNRVTGYAQLYGEPNDRREIFKKGSAAKTIKERVASGRVKINDGHNWLGAMTHGVVTDASEDTKGLQFEALWSTAEDSQSIKTKMLEGILDEWSIEWNAVDENIQKIGEDYFRIINEWIWRGLAIVPHSSQGLPTTLTVNSALPYYDLPLVAMETPWNAAEARERVMQWANGNVARVRQAHVWTNSYSPAADGDGLQIADIVGGRLVAVPQALMRAAGALLGQNGDPEQLVQAQFHMDRYFDRMRTELNAGADLRTPWTYSAIDTILAGIRLNSGTIPADQVAEVVSITKTLLSALPVEERVRLHAGEPQDAGPGTVPPTAEITAGNSDEEQNASRRELEELEIELGLLAR